MIHSDSQLQKNLKNAPENLQTLRRLLKLSQRELIQVFLTDDEGKSMISVGTLSNMERGSLANIERIVQSIAYKTRVSADLFLMNPNQFANDFDSLFEVYLTSKPQDDIGPFSQIHSTSSVEVITRAISEHLMDALISGQIKPGDMLPSDRTLSEQLGMTRTSVREALKVLHIMGLIQVHPGRRPIVASKSNDLFLSPLSWTFLLGQQNVEHIMDVRRILEIESARLTALKAQPNNIQDLRNTIEKMRKACKSFDVDAFSEVDVDFHLVIAESSGNPIIVNLLTTSGKLLSFISKSGMSTQKQMDEIFHEHLKIFEAIIAADSDSAQKSMKYHLDSAAERYKFDY